MGKFEEIIADEIYNNKRTISELKNEFEKDLKKIQEEIRKIYERTRC